MHSSFLFLGALASAAFASPIVGPRASCTFTDAASAIKNKASCSTIILKDIAVPAGTTLDLTKLATGTHVSNFGVQLRTVPGLTWDIGHFPGKDYLRLQGVGRSSDLLHW